jgi:hypothetical protein
MCGQRNGEASFNLKAAPALGLDVPRKLRAFADELIESVDDRLWPGAAVRCDAAIRPGSDSCSRQYRELTSAFGT